MSNIPFVDLKPQYLALKDDIQAAIQRVLEHGRFIMGPEVETCEKQLAEFVGAQHAIGCSSGTDALLLALLALDIGPGDQVITTPFSFGATAEVIILTGATPVFVDVDPRTFNLDPSKIEAALTKNTKAIIPVALFGQPADMDEIEQMAKENNLWVIEDAAQSFGAPYKNRRSGALGHISCTSFFPAKPLGAYGDAGGVFTDDANLALKMRQLLNHGQTSRNYYEYIGINGRLDTLQAAILSCKIKRYPEELKNRGIVASRYTQRLTGPFRVPFLKEDRESAWAQYTLVSKHRDSLQNYLSENGVPSVVYYPSLISDSPAYRERSICHDVGHAKKLTQQVLSLPFYADLTEDIQEKIIETLQNSPNND